MIAAYTNQMSKLDLKKKCQSLNKQAALSVA